MPIGVTLEDEARAQRVVDASKRTAHVDTGRLKRSIDVKVQRGILTFRQYFYGIYNDNSRLVDNAKKMMGDTPYIIELLDEEGNIENIVTKRSSGRTIKSSPSRSTVAKRLSNAKQLITKTLEKRAKDAEKDTDKDN